MTDDITGGAPGGGAPVTPSAPAAAVPAAPTTPTPAATPVGSSTPAAEVPTLTRNPGESDDAFLARFHTEQDKSKPVTGDEKPLEPVKPAEPAKATEPVKPAVEPEKPVAEAKPAEPAAPAAVSKLAETIFANEKLAAMLEEAGVKDELAEELRTAAEGREFRQVFTDLETAKFARVQAEGFMKADLAASNLKRGDLSSTQTFVRDVLMPMSYIYNEDGTPKMVEIDGPNGKISVPETDGTVQVMLENFRDLAVDQSVADASQMLRWAEANAGDARSAGVKERAENILAAIDILRGHFQGTEPEEQDLPESVKTEKAKVVAEKQAFAEQKTKEGNERWETFRSDTEAKASQATDGKIDEWLSQTSLAPSSGDSEESKKSKEFLREGVRTQIRNKLYEKFKADPFFVPEQSQASRRGANASTAQALVNVYKRYTEKYIYDVAQPILAAAGHERVRQAKARAEKIATQTEQSRMDTRAGAKPAIPTVPKVDELQVMRDARAELINELRREPTDDEKVARWRQKMTLLARPA